MNTKLKWILALVLLVALLLWLLFQDKGQKAVVAKTEMPSISNADPLTAPKLLAKGEPKAVDVNTEPAPDDELITEEAVRSYLVVYRDLQLARDCSDIYMKQHWNGQSKDQIFDSLHRYALKNEAALIKTQQIFNKLYNRCMNLAAQVKQQGHNKNWEFDYASPALKSLSKELTTAPTVNITEERFKKLVEFKHKLSETFSHWFQASLGKHKLNRSERKVINEQIKEISESIHQLGYGPEFKSQRESLYEQKKVLFEQKEQRLPPDEALLNQISRYHQQLTERLWPSLASRHVGAFILVFNALNNTNYFHVRISKTEAQELNQPEIAKQLITVNQVLFEAAPFQRNESYFDVVGEAAGFIFLCELGKDCSENSTITRDYCLGMNELPRVTAACGLDVMTFLKDHYISPNLWPDVNAMVLTIKELVHG